MFYHTKYKSRVSLVQGTQRNSTNYHILIVNGKKPKVKVFWKTRFVGLTLKFKCSKIFSCKENSYAVSANVTNYDLKWTLVVRTTNEAYNF